MNFLNIPPDSIKQDRRGTKAKEDTITNFFVTKRYLRTVKERQPRPQKAKQ